MNSSFFKFHGREGWESNLRLPSINAGTRLQPELRPGGSGLTLSSASLPRFQRMGLGAAERIKIVKIKGEGVDSFPILMSYF